MNLFLNLENLLLNSSVKSYICIKKCTAIKVLTRAWIFEWFKRLKDGREDIEDGSRLGHPYTSTTKKIFDFHGIMYLTMF